MGEGLEEGAEALFEGLHARSRLYCADCCERSLGIFNCVDLLPGTGPYSFGECEKGLPQTAHASLC